MNINEEVCKGLVYRLSINQFINKRGQIIYKETMTPLKRESCPGCKYCGWLKDTLLEFIAMGDDILIELTSLISSATRAGDTFARWGGEEFIILLPSSNLQSSIGVANKLKQIIDNQQFSHGLNVTCSFGVTQAKSDDDVETFSKRVDDALYKAKENGRDRVEAL